MGECLLVRRLYPAYRSQRVAPVRNCNWTCLEGDLTMVNILPQDSLKTVRHFYRSRAVVAGSLVASACGAVALLALLSAYTVINTVPASLEGFPEVKLPASSGEDREEVVRAQILLKEFEPLASSASSSMEFIGAALLARPAGVLVQNIHITRGTSVTLVAEYSRSVWHILITNCVCRTRSLAL